MRDNPRNYFLRENLWNNLNKKNRETAFEKKQEQTFKTLFELKIH